MKILAKINPVVLLILVLFSCQKSSTVFYVGNGYIATEFPGAPTGGASYFTIGDTAGYIGLGVNVNSSDIIIRLNDFWKFRPSQNGQPGGGAWDSG